LEDWGYLVGGLHKNCGHEWTTLTCKKKKEGKVELFSNKSLQLTVGAVA
jgi:hypothetical protein